MSDLRRRPEGLVRLLPALTVFLCLIQPVLDVTAYWLREFSLPNAWMSILRLLLLLGGFALGFLVTEHKRFYLCFSLVILAFLTGHVARDQRIRIKELYEWTIYEFELIRAAIDRERRFMVFGIGENSGMVKFPKGNPYPSIFFDKPANVSGVIDAGEFTSRISGAVQTTDKLPDNLPTITK